LPNIAARLVSVSVHVVRLMSVVDQPNRAPPTISQQLKHRRGSLSRRRATGQTT
jgi:hypothetical protein